ncbi:MAG: hypothetical protein IPM46_00455 [Flavobacteriales bacterium]|nr:hypothetical protein [Flavobacteriales bacterium]
MMPYGYNLNRLRQWFLGGILLAATWGQARAQEYPLLQDSLEAELQGAQNDLVRIRIHIRLAEVHIDLLDYTTALAHLRTGVEMAGRLHDAQGAAYADLITGLEAYEALRYNEALESFRSCIDRLDKIKVEQGFLSPLGLIRMVYNDAGLQEEKHLFYKDKLAYYEKHGPLRNTGACHHGLAGFFYLTGQTEKAIEHYLRARELFAEFDPVGYANQLAPVSTMYMTWGNLDKAEVYRRQALEENMKCGNMSNLLFAYAGLSEILLMKGDTTGALATLKMGRPLWRRAVPQLVAPSVQNLFTIHLEQGRMDSAGHYLSMLDSLAALAPMRISSVKGEIEVAFSHYRFAWAMGDRTTAIQALELALQQADDEHLIRFMQKYRKELSTRYAETGQVQRSLVLLSDYVRIGDS